MTNVTACHAPCPSPGEGCGDAVQQCIFHVVLLLLLSFALGCQDPYTGFLSIVLAAHPISQCPHWPAAKHFAHTAGDSVHIGMCNVRCAPTNLWQRLIPILLPIYAFRTVSNTGAVSHEGYLPGWTRADNVLPHVLCIDPSSRVGLHAGEGTSDIPQQFTLGSARSQAFRPDQGFFTQLVAATFTCPFGIMSYLSVPLLQPRGQLPGSASVCKNSLGYASFAHASIVKQLLCTRVGEAANPGPEDNRVHQSNRTQQQVCRHGYPAVGNFRGF